MRDAKLGPNTRYRATKVNGKRVAVHRIVAEAMLGRPLVPGEVVHHINHDRIDNRPENLVVLDEVTHQLEHHPPVHPVFKSCVICGREFKPHKTKRKRQQTCGSSSCRSALIAVNRHGVAIAAARDRFAPEVAEAPVRANLPGASSEETAA